MNNAEEHLVLYEQDDRTIAIGKRARRRDAGLTAIIAISIANPKLRRAVTGAITAKVRSVSVSAPVTPPVVRVRTRRAARSLGALAAAVVIVPVTAKNARHLPEIVVAIAPSNPLGIQLVWDGTSPAREVVEPSIFVVLEEARARPNGVRVVLARSETPALVLCRKEKPSC